MKEANVISFPLKSNKRKKVSRIKNADSIKYFTKNQIQLLRRTVREQAQLALRKKTSTAVKEWMVVDLITSTGIRVSEAADMRCGDIKCGYGDCSIFVRQGKGSKSRTIQIPEALKAHLNSFLRWKENQNESISSDSHLFIGQRGAWTSQAVQGIIKKYLKQLGLYECGKSVHALRHSYAVELYRREKDIRCVQIQLGHSSVQTTMIYAGVLAEDIQKQVKGLWSGRE